MGETPVGSAKALVSALAMTAPNSVYESPDVAAHSLRGDCQHFGGSTLAWRLFVSLKLPAGEYLHTQ